MTNIIKITSAKFIIDYKINITFEDGEERLVDFYSFINKSLNPSIKNYLELKKFKTFEIKNGQLMWGDYELIFPVKDLYDNSL